MIPPNPAYPVLLEQYVVFEKIGMNDTSRQVIETVCKHRPAQQFFLCGRELRHHLRSRGFTPLPAA